ncbi:hypothetical protein BH24ACT7_BH24ACT7_23540 [soil metagenome]
MWLGVIVLGVASACTGTEAAVTTTVPLPDPTSTTSSPTTTAVQPTTTTAATTTTAPNGPVGDPEALRALFDTYEGLILQDVAYDEPIPYPDLTNADPVVALADAFRFEVWIMENGSHVSWAEVYNYPESSRIRSIATDLGRWQRTHTLFPGIVSTYEFVSGERVPIARADLTENELAGLPDGSVAVRFTDRGGPYPRIDATTSDVLEAIGPWEGSGIAILSPTENGWQLYFEDRTETAVTQ